VRIATRDDDAGLRDCLRRTAMGGRVSIAFEREPNFFDSLDVHGPTTLLAADDGTHGGEMLGFALRSSDTLWVEGQRERVGYLGNLRVRPDSRDIKSLKLGWDVIHQLHRDDPIDFYYTTIQETNEIARKVLEGGRFNIPHYQRINTIVSHIFSPRATGAKRVCDIVSGDSVGVDEIVRAMDELGPQRNLFPCMNAEDLLGTKTRGMDLSDIFLAVEGSKVLGMLARWRQREFKQVRVVGYPTTMRIIRPFLNATSFLTASPHIPSAGKLLNIVYLSLPLVRDERTDVFAQLLEHVARSLENTAHCTLGICENDPLLAAMPRRSYRERFGLYLVSPDGKAPELTRVPYVEAGTL
jgi:hypothetical protein